MATPTSVSQSIVSESPEVEAYKLNLLKNASDLAYNAGRPTLASQLPSYQVAGFAPSQDAALKAAATTGIGAFAPYLSTAQGYLSGAAGTTADAATLARGADTRAQFGGAQGAYTAAGTAAGNIAGAVPAFGIGLGTLSAANLLAGIGSTANLTGATTALGTAQTGLTGAAGTMGTGLGQVASGVGQYNPATGATAFMNPYTVQVINAQMAEIDRQQAIQQNQATARATAAGAFGGDRSAVERAELSRNASQLRNQAIAQGMQQNYGQAQQAAMEAYEREQQRDLAAGQATGQLGQGLAGIAGQQANIGNILGQQGISQAQLAQGAGGLMGQLGGQYGSLAGQYGNVYAQQAAANAALGQGIGSLAAQQYGIGQNMATTLGTLGGQMGNLGVQQAALGSTAQQLNQNDINMLYNAGQAQQTNNQAVIDANRANTLQQVYAPYQQAAFLSDIYKGAPSTQMQTAGASSAQPSPFMQAAGLGIGALGAAAGAKKAGLF